MKTLNRLTQAACLLASVHGLAQMQAAKTTPITFDMMHTIQVCVPVAGHQPTFCNGATDTKPSAEATGLEKKITGLLDRALKNPSKASVYAAEFSFSDTAIQNKMCELGKAGIPVEVYVDYASSANVDFTKKPDCQKDPSKPNLRGYVLGGFTNFPEWRLHHNKTVIIDTGDGSPVDIAFSSGNLSVFGVSLHMDHWVFLNAPSQSNIAKATRCMFNGLEQGVATAAQTGMYANGPDFSKDPAVMDAYQGQREQCYKKNNVIPMGNPEAAIAAEGIAPFFTPNDGQYALSTLKNEILKVIPQNTQQNRAFIYIAIEHFSSAMIANALNTAANAGVDVRIIMNSGTVSGNTEVASDGPFYNQYLKSGKIKVRFIETNPQAGGNGQQMHNKFAILNDKRVFSGAGHYTSSGLNTNFETLYLTQNQPLTEKYEAYFQELWEQSVDENYITKHTPIVPGVDLDPDAQESKAVQDAALIHAVLQAK